MGIATADYGGAGLYLSGETVKTPVRIRKVTPCRRQPAAQVILDDLQGRPVMALRTDSEVARSLMAELAGAPSALAVAAELLDNFLDGLDLQLLTVTLCIERDVLSAQLDVSTGTSVKRVQLIIDPGLAVFLGQHLELPLYVAAPADRLGWDSEHTRLTDRPTLRYSPQAPELRETRAGGELCE